MAACVGHNFMSLGKSVLQNKRMRQNIDAVLSADEAPFCIEFRAIGGRAPKTSQTLFSRSGGANHQRTRKMPKKKKNWREQEMSEY
jgi:hypothetical protein